jgi:uncharacterized protein Smg (DUF494 family)
MNKRILDILSYVMREIRDNSYEDIDLQLVVDILVEQGFSDQDISTAMSWLMHHGETIDRVLHGFPVGIPRPIWRQLNDLEKNAISPKAFGYLFHLRDLDILNDMEMENIIDRAVSLDINHIDVEDMQDLIAAVVLDFENSASQGYFQYTTTRLPH